MNENLQKQSGNLFTHTLSVIFHLRFVDENTENYILLLRQAVSICSVSCEPKRREDVFTMASWMAEKLRYIGVTVELYDLAGKVS